MKIIMLVILACSTVFSISRVMSVSNMFKAVSYLGSAGYTYFVDGNIASVSGNTASVDLPEGYGVDEYEVYTDNPLDYSIGDEVRVLLDNDKNAVVLNNDVEKDFGTFQKYAILGGISILVAVMLVLTPFSYAEDAYDDEDEYEVDEGFWLDRDYNDQGILSAEAQKEVDDYYREHTELHLLRQQLPAPAGGLHHTGVPGPARPELQARHSQLGKRGGLSENEQTLDYPPARVECIQQSLYTLPHCQGIACATGRRLPLLHQVQERNLPAGNPHLPHARPNRGRQLSLYECLHQHETEADPLLRDDVARKPGTVRREQLLLAASLSVEPENVPDGTLYRFFQLAYETQTSPVYLHSPAGDRGRSHGMAADEKFGIPPPQLRGDSDRRRAAHRNRLYPPLLLPARRQPLGLRL